MSTTAQPGVGPEHPCQGLQVEKPLPVAGDAVKGDPLLCQPLKRPHDGVVLHGGNQAVVPGAQRPAQHQVQPPGVAGGEDGVGGVVKVKQLAQPLAQRQGHLLGLLGGAVDPTVHVGTHMGDVFRHPRRHTGRLGVGGGGLIQIDGGHDKAPFYK